MSIDLTKRIKIILDSEWSAYKQNGRIRGGLGTFNINLQSVPNLGWTNEGSVTQYLFDEIDRDFIKSENANLILNLYSSLEEKERGEFENVLLNHLDREDYYKDVSYLVVFVFIRIGKLELAINKAFECLKGDSNNAYSNVLHMLKLVISREYSFFLLKNFQTFKICSAMTMRQNTLYFPP